MKVEFNKEMELLKKTQTEIKLTSEVSLTNRLKNMGKRMSGLKDKVEEPGGIGTSF